MKDAEIYWQGQWLCNGIAKRMPRNRTRIQFVIHNGESLDHLKRGAELVFSNPLPLQDRYSIVGIIRESPWKENDCCYLLEVRKLSL